MNHSSDAAHSSPQDVASKIAFQSILVIGGGIGLALVVLFGLTFLVLRPR